MELETVGRFVAFDDPDGLLFSKVHKASFRFFPFHAEAVIDIDRNSSIPFNSLSPLGR